MVRRVTPAQLQSMILQAQQIQRQAMNNVNSEIRKYNNAVDNYNRERRQAITKYNQAVSTHNAKVRANRARLQSEVRRLNSTPATTVQFTTSTRTVRTVEQRFSGVESAVETGRWTAPENFLDLVEGEAADSVAALNRLIAPAEEDEAENLQAALDTYLEEPSDHLPWDPDSKVAYDPVGQARGYARSALYNLAQFHLELKRFMSKHGGLWLLSDADVEQNVADAVYGIGWHNSLHDEDESFLRRHLADSRHEEVEHFWNVIQGFPQGLRIHDLWQDMVRDGVGMTTDEQKEASQVWLTIAACRDYVQKIDDDWLRIADWYRPESSPNRSLNGAGLYDKYLAARRLQEEL